MEPDSSYSNTDELQYNANYYKDSNMHLLCDRDIESLSG